MTPFSLFLPFHFLSLSLSLSLRHFALDIPYIWMLFSRFLHSSLLTTGISTKTPHRGLVLEEGAPKHVGIVCLVGRFVSTHPVFGMIRDLFRSLVYKQFSALALKIIIHFPKLSNVLAYTNSLVILTYFQLLAISILALSLLTFSLTTSLLFY